MSEKVEQVQAVLLKSLAAQGLLMITPQFAVVPHGRDIVIDCASLARASIEAMREPTEPLTAAGYCALSNDSCECDADKVWRAMIDAALRE